jgi:holo-[acyl-carrier protein] synthase
MIVGIGLDLVDVSRMGEQVAGEAFQRRAFTPAEIAVCAAAHRPPEHFAGKFAAKEALMKALGAGLRQGLRFGEIEILDDEAGAPHVRASGEAQQRLEALGVSGIHVSITHAAGLAAAVVVLERA